MAERISGGNKIEVFGHKCDHNLTEYSSIAKGMSYLNSKSSTTSHTSTTFQTQHVDNNKKREKSISIL